MIDHMNLESSDYFSDLIIIDQTNPKISFKSLPSSTVNETQNYKLDLILSDNHSVSSIDFYYAKDKINFIFLDSKSEVDESSSNEIENDNVSSSKIENESSNNSVEELASDLDDDIPF